MFLLSERQPPISRKMIQLKVWEGVIYKISFEKEDKTLDRIHHSPIYHLFLLNERVIILTKKTCFCVHVFHSSIYGSDAQYLISKAYGAIVEQEENHLQPKNQTS